MAFTKFCDFMGCQTSKGPQTFALNRTLSIFPHKPFKIVEFNLQALIYKARQKGSSFVKLKNKEHFHYGPKIGKEMNLLEKQVEQNIITKDPEISPKLSRLFHFLSVSCIKV